VTILFPDGRTEYWFTALVFRAGDTLDHDGESWVVTSIAPPDGGLDGDGKHTTVTVRADGVASGDEVTA
jgi:hypothetical protein